MSHLHGSATGYIAMSRQWSRVTELIGLTNYNPLSQYSYITIGTEIFNSEITIYTDIDSILAMLYTLNNNM